MSTHEDVLADVGSYIRAQREIARLSLRHLARLTHVSDSYLSQVERGMYQPSPDVLRAIAEGLGLAPEQFFRRMGWLTEVDRSVEGVIESILADDRLSTAQKAALTATYQAMVGD